MGCQIATLFWVFPPFGIGIANPIFGITAGEKCFAICRTLPDCETWAFFGRVRFL
jgi:hypothetical protein